MKIIVQVDFGLSKNARLARSYYNSIVFSCYDNDVSSAYNALAEIIILKDIGFRIIFETLKVDKDVRSFLEDAKQQGFIEDYKIQ